MGTANSKSVAFILCDNGLGHTRRGFAIASRLSSLLRNIASGWEVVVFANPDRVSCLNIDDNVTFSPFATCTSARSFIGDVGNQTNWVSRFVEPSKYQVVVSDNLIEILKVRPDAVLCGSFLWHLDLADCPEQVKKASNLLLKSNAPTMLGSKIFASKEHLELVDFVDIGLIPSFQSIPQAHRDSILFSCGQGSQLATEFRQAMENVAGIEKPEGLSTLFVEPFSLPAKHPAWMQPARYDAAMYSRIKFAAVRPGLGTVSDLLFNQVFSFMFGESDNQEMARNSRVVEENGFGRTTTSIGAAFDLALKSCQKGSRFQSPHLATTGAFQAVARGLSFRGVESAAESLIEIMRKRSIL